MSKIKMYAPWIKDSQVFLTSDGNKVTPSAGVVQVPPEDFLTFFRAGFREIGMPKIRYTTLDNANDSVLANNCMIFGDFIYVEANNANAANDFNATTEDAANMLAILPNPKPYDYWFVRILNYDAANITIVAGNDVTITGNSVINSNTWMDFIGYIDGDNASIQFRQVGAGNVVA